MPDQENSTNWSAYYRALDGRPPRTLLLDALVRWEAAPADGVPRQAIDLGCGDGTETLVLLQHGWHVLAVDREPEAITYVRAKVSPAQEPRLQTQIAAFEDVCLPPSDLIYAGLSLPFCAPASFAALWARIVAALRPGGRFAGQFFGERDSWAVYPAMNFHSAAQVRQFLQGLTIEYFRELDEDGMSFSGPKHWHMFEVIARNSDPDPGKLPGSTDHTVHLS